MAAWPRYATVANLDRFVNLNKVTGNFSRC